MLFNIDAGARGLLARHGRSDELDPDLSKLYERCPPALELICSF